MKLVMRADDFGYTKVYNDGMMKAVREGVVTYVDLMLDCPGTEDAIEQIKAYPWISVGWHGGHFWGRPVADPKLIPSLLNEAGQFKFRIDQELKNDVVYEEALIECRAQVEKCIRLLGHAPVCTSINHDYLFERARAQVCDEYGIAYDFMRKLDRKSRKEAQPAEKWKHLNIFMPCQHDSCYKILYSDAAENREKYDPVAYYVNDDDQLLKEDIVITAWHPGYLDDIIYFDSSKHFNLARVIDIKAMCDPKLKQWIIDHKVELVGIKDALYGTQDYQNYLRSIDSELCMINK